MKIMDFSDKFVDYVESYSSVIKENDFDVLKNNIEYEDNDINYDELIIEENETYSEGEEVYDPNAGMEYDFENNDEKVEIDEDISKTDLMLDLIALYKNHPVLWNPKNIQQHKIEQIKNESYNEIAKTLQERHDTIISADTVKNRIQNLRKQFYNEENLFRKKIKPASALWYFNKMSFLLENKTTKEDPLYFEENSRESTINEFEENKSNIEFIKIFKKLPCLWDEENQYYENPDQVQIAYDYFIEQMQTNVDCILTKEMVKEKIDFIQMLNKESNDNENWYDKELEFLTKKNINTKKQKNEHQPTELTCQYCNKKFQSETKLRDHQYEEYGVAKYTCKICNKSFKTAENMKRHSHIHLKVEDRSFACAFCAIQFSDKLSCDVHMRRHTRECTYKCRECCKTFSSFSELKNHMQYHSGKRSFFCDTCGKSFKSSSNFNSHRQSHIKNRIYDCTICLKKFYLKDALREHIKTHTNVRDITCDICGKSFKVRKTMMQHRQIHSEKKQYACKICGREFAQAAGLNAHLRSHKRDLEYKNLKNV